MPPPPPPPPPALVVRFVLNEANPYMELTFSDSRYSEAHERKHTLIIGANDHLCSILLDQPLFFGIHFRSKEVAQSWYDAVEAPWRGLFSRDPESRTAWIRRRFSTDDLMRKMPLPMVKRTNSWRNGAKDNSHDKDDQGKSNSSPMAALTNGVSKVTRKVVGKGKGRN